MAAAFTTLLEIPSWDRISHPAAAARSNNPRFPVNYTINSKVSLWGDGNPLTTEGDITKLKVQAIVNAAKPDLSGGGGVDGKIWQAAGYHQMAMACSELKGCAAGKCKTTKGFKLPVKSVFHTVGPQDADPIVLRTCYESCLEKLRQTGYESLAFCCISTGIYGFPNRDAAHIALSTTRQWLESNHQQVARIIFCVWESVDLSIYTELMRDHYFRVEEDFNISTDLDVIFVGTGTGTPADIKDNKRKIAVADDNSAAIADKENVASSLPTTRGRKKKKGSTGCCIKKLPDEKAVPECHSYHKFSELPSNDMVTIFYDEIISDVMKKDKDGFYFKQAKNVQVVYSMEDGKKVTIRLDNLLERGFPKGEVPDKLLTLEDLQTFIDSHPSTITIVGVQTDLDEEMSTTEVSWKYRDSAQVKILYAVDGNECGTPIRLDNLRERGFPVKKYRYYSFLYLKESAQKNFLSPDDIKSDETLFMDSLDVVNDYFRRHPDQVENQNIVEFSGPQCYADRNNSSRFYYYGNGQYRYYRQKDLVELLHKDFGQVKANEFINDPANSKFVSDEIFCQYLQQIHDNIRQNKSNYHHLFVPFSGPQCFEDLELDPKRLCYDVNYKQHSKKESSFAAPRKENVEGLRETFDESRFSLRVCVDCENIRVLGCRAAKKYPMCYYEFQGKRHFVNFHCNQLHGLKACEDDCGDVVPIAFDGILLNGRYILYCKEDTDYVYGYFIKVLEKDSSNQHVRFEVVKAFGSNTWVYDDYSTMANNWLNRTIGDCWQHGSLSKSGRWKCDPKSPKFTLSKILVEFPREAKSSQVFYDTHIGYVDHDDPTEKISFGSLLRVRNSHKLLQSLKLLHCVKCKRTVPGIEKFNSTWFHEDCSFDKTLQDVYLNSEVVNATNMFLDEKFSTTDVYCQSDTKVIGVCTECSPNFSIDEESSTVNPIFLDFADSQSDSSQHTSSSQGDTTTRGGVMKTNLWGPENLFTLDLFDDESYACFMRSLTLAERLVITPLHILINVLRCRSTQMPFVTNSSIAFPLQSIMETTELPWTGFRSLPFIVVVYSNGDPNDTGLIKEAKINLNKIVRARDLMTQRFDHPLFPSGRPRYRFVNDGFRTFTDEQMTKLRDELMQADNLGYSEPVGLRKIFLDEIAAELSKTVPKLQVQNWIVSDYPYASSIHNGCMSDETLLNDEGNLEFEIFWSCLKKYIFELNGSSGKEIEDDMITYDLLFQFADSKGWINIITSNVKSEMLEEFSVLASCFTNDEGPSDIAQGCVFPETTNDPDEIYRTNIQNTALDRRNIAVDRSQKAAEWSPGYLQKAFPHIFLSGDADFHQWRPIPINQTAGAKREYLHRLCMLKEVNEDIIATFTINIILRKLDAFKAATVLMKDVDIHNISIPTKQQLLDNPDNATGASKMLLQYSAMTCDSEDFWKLEMKNEIGTKRDLEYMNEFSRPDKQHPTHAALFRTMAPSYRSAYYFHRLFSYRSDEDMTDIKHRKAKVLSQSMVIEWVCTLLAELDIKYLAPHRCPHVNFVMRYENGKYGNPHHHSLLYSDQYGEKNWELITELENTFDKLCAKIKEESNKDTWSEQDKKKIVNTMISRWNDCKQVIVDFFSGMYTNWNPNFTSSGEPTRIFKSTPNITTISPSDIIDDCLASGDMTVLDELYAGIVNFHCRHIVHRGKDGKPAKTDYCYKEDLKKDPQASLEKGKAVYKKIVKCSRRKPQKKRSTAAIHVDAHDNKLYQLTFESNDEYLNGADLFLILLVLGNADTKALVQPEFTRKPKFEFSETNFDATMTLYISPGDSAVEYVIKYMQKNSIPTKTHKEIFMNVAKKTEHPITEKGVYQCYTQAAIQGSTSLLAAQHINLNLPLVQRNTQCKSINVTGRKSLKVSKNPDCDDYLNESRIDEFEARLGNLSPRTSVDIMELQGEMSMREFFDKYIVSWDKQKQLIVHPNRRVKTNRKNGAEITLTSRLTPHTSMIQANPNRKTYPMFCKKMCLWTKRYGSIRSTVPVFSQSQEDEENMYWLDVFNTEFPNGEGLETTFKAYVQHYAKKDADTDEDDDVEDAEEEDGDYDADGNDIGDKSHCDDGHGAVLEKDAIDPAMKGKTDFYQTSDDMLLRPGDNDNVHAVVLDQDDEELVRKSDEYMANARLEDFMDWLPEGENINKDFIEMRLREISDKHGVPVPTYPTRSLTPKQELSHRIIMNWVEDRMGERKLKPLRLFVLGLPGVGKTFSFKVTATQIMDLLGDQWIDMMRIATPTGCVSSHVGYNAQTLHRTFYIRVGFEDENLAANIERITELKQRLPQSIILIVFDECSMISRFIFAIILNRLELAGICTADIGVVLFGDPAQTSPIGGKPIWCYVEDEKDRHLSLEGIHAFRQLFRMKPLQEVEGYRHLKYWSKKDKYNKEYLRFYKKFGKKVFDGDYNAVYMDEVMRTDNSKASADLKSVQVEGRYGKFTDNSLAKLQSITATQSDVDHDPCWESRTSLTGFHYYSELNPERCSADSMNATSLVHYSNTSGNGIVKFEAIHSPSKMSEKLVSLPAKNFQNLASKLYLARGCRVILTVNINNSLGLFNGAAGKFIGPLYLPSIRYQVKSLDTILKAEIDNDKRTAKQIEVKMENKVVQIPRGALLISLNGTDQFTYKELQVLQEPFIAEFEIPRRPPFLPDYLVVEFEGYADKGGPTCFRDPALKDCVYIRRSIKGQQSDRSSKKSRYELHRVDGQRTCFPIELAYTMTHFKGIGANHVRTELDLREHFGDPGGFLVGISRVINPKHLFIKHWPSVVELNVQRMKEHVIQSENFERFIRIKSARDMRYFGFDLLQDMPVNIDKESYNTVADLIYEEWYNENETRDEISICESVAQNPDVSFDDDIIHAIYTKMKHSDEYLVTRDVPHLSNSERYVLGHFAKNKKKKGPVVVPVLPSLSSKRKSATDDSLNLKRKKAPITTASAPLLLPRGLPNIGNTCYINSVFQLLRPISCDLIPTNGPFPDIETRFYAIMNLLKSNQECSTVLLLEFKNMLKEIMTMGNDESANITQEDVQEAMTKLFEQCRQLQLSVEFWTRETLSCVQTDCDQSNEPRNVQSYFLNVHPSRENVPLQECIDALMAPEEVTCTCEKCGHPEMQQVMRISRNPRILLIQVTTPRNPNGRNNYIKIDHEISVNDVVYTFKSAIQYDGYVQDGVTGGHFLTYAIVDSIWFRFNDSRVEPVSLAGVEIAASNFYILCFEETGDEEMLV